MNKIALMMLLLFLVGCGAQHDVAVTNNTFYLAGSGEYQTPEGNKLVWEESKMNIQDCPEGDCSKIEAESKAWAQPGGQLSKVIILSGQEASGDPSFSIPLEF